MKLLEVTFPLRLGRGKNDRGGWKAQFYRRAKKGQGAGTLQAREQTAAWLLTAGLLSRTQAKHAAQTGAPLAVELWRIAPAGTPLDDDNLAAALKPVRDEVARFLGVNDGSAQVRWLPMQCRGAWGVRVVIFVRTESQRQDPGSVSV
jgi:hypothetical protein